MSHAGQAQARWLDRFQVDDRPPALVAQELYEDVREALGQTGEPERLRESAHSVALLRANQGRSAASLIDDVLALRPALATADAAAGALLLAHQRLSDVLDAVLQHAVEAWVAETQAVLSMRATRDTLTGLLNRAAFDEALHHECASAERGDPPALLLLDLDGFKGVNDALGHLAGDDVLATVGAILTRAVRRSDVVARLGGDEFAVLMPRTNAKRGLDLAERLVAATRRSRALELPGAPTRVGVSVGVACLTEPEPDALYDAADTAMYEAKRAGKGRAALFRPATVST